MENILNTLTVLKKKSGDIVELRTHFGAKGYLIDRVTKNASGHMVKSFSAPSMFPVNKKDIYPVLLEEIDKLLRAEHKFQSSTVHLSFPMQHRDWLLATNDVAPILDKDNVLEDMQCDDDYIFQVVPMPSQRVFITIDIDSSHAISMANHDGTALAIPPALLAKLGVWLHKLSGRISLEGRLTRANRLVLTDIFFKGESLSDKPITKRLMHLYGLAHTLPDGVSIAHTEFCKEHKLQLVDTCIRHGMELVIIPKNLRTCGNASSKLNLIMHFKKETTLQIMSINLIKGTVSLCGRVAGIPITVAEAFINPQLSLQVMDNVVVEYSGIESGKLLHVEMKEKTGFNDHVDLDPVIANSLGYNLKPTAVLTPTAPSDRNEVGILGALDIPEQ